MVLKRVLSIQSHVVSGYVGNKAATFPLQVLGYDVDAVNSVQFSNHARYEHCTGQMLQSDELKMLFEGLKLNNIHRYSHLLTGFSRSESFLREVVNVLRQLKDTNPGLIYVCDPVLGDGRYYVPDTLMPIYRDELLPHADIITPNQFEAEVLSGMKINTETDAFQVISCLQKKGPRTVIITSCDFQNDDKLVLLAGDKEEPNEFIRMEVSKVNANIQGTGDLFSSMFLAWCDRYPCDIKASCEYTMTIVQQIITKTVMHAKHLAGLGNTPTAAQRELRLVDSLDIIRTPKNVMKAEEIHL